MFSIKGFLFYLLFTILFLCVACGTFSLASKVQAPSGTTKDQMQNDTLFCKDQAKMAANSAERQAGAFLLGATIIGTPVAYEMEKTKQREVFAECMTAKGYTVFPADDDPNKTTVAAPVAPDKAETTASITYPSKVNLPLPSGWEQLKPTKVMLSGNVIVFAKNLKTNVLLALSAEKRESVKDLMGFAIERRTRLAKVHTNAWQSEVSQIEINGIRALRFDVTGTLKNGKDVTYLVTVIEGATEIAILITSTDKANYERHKEEMKLLAYNVTGLTEANEKQITQTKTEPHRTEKVKVTQVNSTDAGTNIEKLDKLRKDGVISEDEYRRAKDKILPPQTDDTETAKKLQELDDLHKKGILSEYSYNKAKKRVIELQKLNELRNSGVLSEEEYNKAKARAAEK